MASHARDAGGPGADRHRRCLRDGDRIHVQPTAGGVRLPLRECARLCAAGARSRLPRRAGHQSLNLATAQRPSRGDRDRCSRWRLRGVGLEPSCAPAGRLGRVLVRLSAGLPDLGPQPSALRRRVPGRHCSGNPGNALGNLDLAGKRSDGPRHHRQPAQRRGGRLRVVRPGRRARGGDSVALGSPTASGGSVPAREDGQS